MQSFGNQKALINYIFLIQILTSKSQDLVIKIPGFGIEKRDPRIIL